MLFLSMTLLRCNTKTKTSIEVLAAHPKSYTLKIERGAFHYDSFLLEGDTLRYIPQENSAHPNRLYNEATSRFIDSAVTNGFFNKIVSDGFWELKKAYKSGTSCTSQLRVTLKTDDRTKTVTCDDFERDCPELIKYIDKKVVALEGNGLVRIYLPG